MKERAIYYPSGIITGIILCAVLCSFTGEDRLESLSAIHIANIIEEYEAEGYVFDKLKMKKKDDCFEIIDCNFVMSEPNEWGTELDYLLNDNTITAEPNEASYKAFFGWE